MSDDGRISHDFLLPEKLRERLSKSFGTVVSGERLADGIKRCARVISVGDIVTCTLLSGGIEPHLMVFDMRTRRGSCDALAQHRPTEGVQRLRTSNPPGRLSSSLWNAIADALRSRKRTEIEVDGEEDLASLACIYLSEPGDCVIYGIPDVGVDIVEVDDEKREIVAGILREMSI